MGRHASHIVAAIDNFSYHSRTLFTRLQFDFYRVTYSDGIGRCDAIHLKNPPCPGLIKLTISTFSKVPATGRFINAGFHVYEDNKAAGQAREKLNRRNTLKICETLTNKTAKTLINIKAAR